MAMDAVLKELESRIEELVKAYQAAKTAESISLIDGTLAKEG
jgi:hypothetical protein